MFLRAKNNARRDNLYNFKVSQAELGGGNCPYNHSVVVYGYSKTVDVWTNELVSMMYHCHFGWKSNDRLQSINYLWFADDLYLP